MTTIVERIREAMERRGGISEEAMRPLAETYASQVTRVNERLHEAVALLGKGLRSEAIQRASLHPNAIDAAAALDFPEVEEWLDVLQFFSVPVPPQINRDATQQLNEAIVETQPLQDLLGNHRRLAIAKAPLPWRLRVLRHIAAADPLNAVWQEDLENWEAERIKQIALELGSAIKADDEAKVGQLFDEMTKVSWRVSLPQALVDQARSAHARFTYDTQLTALQSLTSQLHEAFGGFDQVQGQQLRTEWQQRIAAMQSPPPAELQEHVAPALAWLQELDHEQQRQLDHRSAIGQLEQSLHLTTSIDQLERAYQQAARFDEPLPIELEQRYRNAVATHELVAKRKWQATIAGIAALLMLMLTALGVWQWRAAQQQQLASAAGELGQLLKADQLREAEQFFQQLQASQPEVARSAPLQSLASQLRAKRSKEETRREQFQSYIQLADKPAAADIELPALMRAEALATSEEEKATAFKIRRRRTQWQQKTQQEHSASVMGRLTAASTILDSVEAQSASPQLGNQVRQVILDLDTVLVQFPETGSAVKAQLTVLQSRAQSLRDAIDERLASIGEQQDAFNKIVDAATFESHARGLKNYAQRVPNSPMTGELISVADELPLWSQTLQLNVWTQSLRAAIRKGLPPADAQQLQASLEKLSDDVAIDESILPTKMLEETLAKTAQREAILDRVFGDLEEATIAELVSFHYPQEGSGKSTCWYSYHSHFEDDPQRFTKNTKAQAGIEVVTNGNGAVSPKSFRGRVTVVSEPRNTMRWLAAEKAAHRDRFLSDWNATFMQLVAEVLQRPNLDGIIKETLILHLLEGAAEGSAFLDQRLNVALQHLRSHERSEARSKWYEKAEFDSDLAAELKPRILPEFSKAFRDRDQEWEALRAPASMQFAWVGSVLRNEQGALTVHLKANFQGGSGRLFVARPFSATSARVALAQVGQIENQHATLLASTSGLVAGRPLFLAPHESVE